jgi:cobalt/nickel transport system permease protein
LPATFSFITHGEIVVPLGTWFGHAVGLTRQGLTSAALIIIRVAVSISLVVLLTLTTRWNRLLAALRSVGVPKLFVTVLAMAYRYLFHLLGVVTDMYQARKARTVMPETDIQSGRRFVAASAGALFGKSHALAEEVHMSMVARGFSGDVRAMTEPRIGMLDVIWTLGCVLLAILAFGGAHLFGR